MPNKLNSPKGIWCYIAKNGKDEFLKCLKPKPQISKSNSSQWLLHSTSPALRSCGNSFLNNEQPSQALHPARRCSFRSPISYISPCSLGLLCVACMDFFCCYFWSFPAFFPFPQTHLHNPSFRAISGSHSVSPLKTLFFAFASFSSPIASAYTHRHVYKRPLCTSGLLSALAFRIALFSVLFDYKSSFIWAAREIWSEFNFPPKASFVVFGHPSSETLTTPYSSMTRFHINQNANHFLVFLITDVHFSPFIFSSLTTRASRRLFLLVFVGIGFTVEDDKSKSLPRSRKAHTAGSAAIFRLVALLIYFLFFTDYERKQGKKKLSFFCFPLFSRLFFFSTLLSVFSSPCVCGSRASRAQFHFTERKTMWNWKAPSSFPFCHRRSSQKALCSPHPAFVALACNRRCVCVRAQDYEWKRHYDVV